jgi:hypothetical protein
MSSTIAAGVFTLLGLCVGGYASYLLQMKVLERSTSFSDSRRWLQVKKDAYGHLLDDMSVYLGAYQALVGSGLLRKQGKEEDSKILRDMGFQTIDGFLAKKENKQENILMTIELVASAEVVSLVRKVLNEIKLITSDIGVDMDVEVSSRRKNAIGDMYAELLNAMRDDLGLPERADKEGWSRHTAWPVPERSD